MERRPAARGLGQTRMAGCVTVRPAQARTGQLRPGLASSGQDRPGLASSGQLRPAQAGSGQLRPAQAGSGQLRPAQAGSGQLRPAQARTGLGAPQQGMAWSKLQPRLRSEGGDQERVLLLPWLGSGWRPGQAGGQARVLWFAPYVSAAGMRCAAAFSQAASSRHPPWAG